MSDTPNPMDLSESEWKQRLVPEAYNVLRKEGTERAWSSELYEEHRQQQYHRPWRA